jgi:hypothetical protein
MLSQQVRDEIVTGVENTLEYMVSVFLFQDGEFEVVDRAQVDQAMREAVAAIREWLPTVEDGNDASDRA